MFTERLHTIMTALGLSPLTLAREMDCDRSNIDRICKGTRVPRREGKSVRRIVEALYSLADGGKKVSPAVMLGLTDEELRNIANEAVEYSGVRSQAIYQNDLAQMLSEGTAGYVVLSDGIYVYLRGADASNRSSQSFHLVRVCDFWGNALETPVVIDLASNQQLSYYRDLKRDGTTNNAAGGNAGR